MGCKRWATALVISALVGSLAACGSSDSSSGGGGTTGADVVDGAKSLLKTSMGGLAYSDTDFPTKPSQIVAYGDWRGPTSAPKVRSGVNLQVIVCSKQAVACMEAADGISEGAKALGWKVEIIDGAGTPEGYNAAYDTAFTRKPDAIIGIAVPTLSVGEKLAKAKRDGVVTVGVGDIPPTGGQDAYQSYVSFRMPFMEALLAYGEIARTEGKADSIVVTDTGVPALIEAMDQYKKVMKTCSGCKVTDTAIKISDASDPTKITAIISGALSRNPNATSLTYPYTIGLPAVIQAIESAGKAGQVKLLIKDGDAVGLAAVKNGQALYNSGASPTWAGWAALDQAVRGIAKAPYLKSNEIGLGLVTFDGTSVPADSNIDKWKGMPDFRAKYKKAWGVG